jgi:hydroxypyruvate reductase
MTGFELGPHRDDPRRLDLLRVADAALNAVDPFEAVRRAMTRDGAIVRVGGAEFDLRGFDRTVVLGLGKASVAMGRAVVEILDGAAVTGVLVTNAAEPVGSLEVIEGSHPMPDHRSERAGRRVLDHARGAGARDLAVVLVSGGGSALLAVPAAGLDLEDLRQTNEILLRSGAAITEVNTVRKHLSAVKGGRLAEALADAAAVITLVISDVIENPLDGIASGPTVPDPTTYAEALGILDSYSVGDQVPDAVTAHLRAGANGDVPETPFGGPIFERQVVAIVADAGSAAEAAAEAAAAEGFAARVVTTGLQGEAREVARRLVTDANTLDVGELLVYAGETTVTVTGDGRGGRNQELALAASLELAGREDVIILSIGTDGIDGMTPAAGGFGDGTAVERGRSAGLDAAGHLARNDSHSILAAIGDTVVSGPTGTNVGDLVLVARPGTFPPP